MIQRKIRFQPTGRTVFFSGMLVCFFCAQASVVGQPAKDADVPGFDSGKKTKVSDREFQKLVLASISQTGVLDVKRLSESSGLAQAALPGCYWTINDSGNPSDIFLFREDGEKIAKLKIKGAKNRDWESLARYVDGDQQWIVAANVGDNQRSQKRYQLYYFLDPTITGGKTLSKKRLKNLKSARSLAVEFSYSDGSMSGFVSMDCEAVGIDPLNGDVWMTEKVQLGRNRNVKPGLYVLPAPKARLRDFLDRSVEGSNRTSKAASEQSFASKRLIAERIGDFPFRNVTGMSFSPDGKKLIIRNYFSAHLYIRARGKTWRETVGGQTPIGVALPFQGQGEAVCFTADSNSILITSEGKLQPIWKVDLAPYLEKHTAE